MSSRLITRLTPDPELPALQAPDPAYVMTLLTDTIDLRPQQRDALCCRSDVLSHKPGQRCTIRYTVTWPGELECPGSRATFIGKLYGRLPMAERLYRRAESLWSGPFSDSRLLTVPRPLRLVEHLGFVVLEDFRGVDVRHILPADNARVPLSLLGHWLARLHATPPLPGLACRTPEHELEKVHRWGAQIAAVSTRSVARRVARVLEMMRSRMNASPRAPVMIHKDFYHGNALFDGQRVCVVDFDELSIGDPALDVGHFVAHLETFAYRSVGRTDAFSEAARTFVNSYRERAPLTLETSELTFYKAYTFLKLAATEVTRRRAGWRSMTRAFTAMAHRELERAQT